MDGLRTILIRSNGRPMETHIIDFNTGSPINNVSRIEFADLHVDMAKPWMAVLHKFTGEVRNDEFVMEQEQVYVKMSEQL